MELVNEPNTEINEIKWKEFLLMGFSGEKEMMETLHFCTMKQVDTNANDGKQRMWQPASHDYNINPFGKLLDEPSETNERGDIVKHKTYFHGFFINLRCTKDFYEKWKTEIDEYVTEDENIKRDHQPKWFV